ARAPPARARDRRAARRVPFGPASRGLVPRSRRAGARARRGLAHSPRVRHELPARAWRAALRGDRASPRGRRVEFRSARVARLVERLRRARARSAGGGRAALGSAALESLRGRSATFATRALPRGARGRAAGPLPAGAGL